MNRKALLHMSFASLAIIVIIAGLLFSFIPLSSSSVIADVYVVGEHAKLRFSDTESCVVKVSSPSDSFTTRVQTAFTFALTEVGTYTVSVRSCLDAADYSFTVIPQPHHAHTSVSTVSDSEEEGVSIVPSYQIIAGKPVRHVERIVVDTSVDGVDVFIPKDAYDVEVYDVGSVVDSEHPLISYTTEGISHTEDGISALDNTLQKLVVPTDLVSSDIEVVYFTQAPTISEKKTSLFTKEVAVSAPHELNYTNILAYTTIDDAKVSSQKHIRVYWKEAGKDVPFTVHDTDYDGFIDYIQWIVPHLSEQTFEIILISGAQHLDADRAFIADIFSSVYKLDSVWSPVISDGEFVRVTFERNLTHEKDITIFPRVSSGDPSIAVYEKDKNVVIAQFDSIESNTYNKVFLDGLSGSQDVFDLLVFGGSVLFNHIIDPPVDPPTNDTFEAAAPSGWNWSQVEYDDCNWSRNADNDGTPSGSTGPEQDHTLGTISGHFLFTEATASQPCEFGASNTAVLESPEYDADTYNVTIDFWFHMYGAGMGDLSLEINDSNGWHQIWSQVGQNQSAQLDPWLQEVINVGNYSGIVKFRFNGTTGSAYTSDMSIDDLHVSGTIKNQAPTAPTTLLCNDVTNCNITAHPGVTLNCSGSTDADGDPITYFIGATSVVQDFSSSNNNNVSLRGVANTGSNVTIWNKETGAGCASGWTGDSSWTTAEFRALIDGDKSNTSNFDNIRFQFCAGTDENLQVLNVSTCWIDEVTPAATSTCTDALITNEGEGTTGSWFYTEISSGVCEYTSWMEYSWNGTRQYFVQWGSQDGTNIDGNRYVSGCSDTDLSRVQNTNADVMNPSWAGGEVFEAYIYDLQSIEGSTTAPSNETNSSETTYNDIDAREYYSIDNISFIVTVDSYNPEASVDLSTLDPDLFLEVYNGTSWLAFGRFSLNESYTGAGLNTTNENFTIVVTDSTVLSAWETVGNHDARIKAVSLDYSNATLIDEINYTQFFVVIHGITWNDIGNHTNSTTLFWNTTDITDRENIDFRCHANDISGSNTNTSSYTKGSTFAIDHTYPLIAFGNSVLADGATTYVDWIFSNVTVTELHERNITFRLYNVSASLINNSAFGAGNRSLNFTSLSSGLYYYNVTVFDLVNFSNSTETRNISVDITVPLISFSTGTPVNDTNISDDFFYFNVSVTEDNEKNITFSLFNVSHGVVNETTYTTAVRSMNFTDLNEGIYFYNATVFDFGNRSNSTQTYTITLDTGNPTWELTNPSNNTFSNKTSQNLTVNVTDTFGIENVTLYIYNATGQLINQTTVIVGGSLQALVGIVYEFLYDGVFTWFYVISDIAGNTVTTDNRTITIDTTPPNITILNMLNNSADVDGFVTISYSLADVHSTISNCSLYVGGSLNHTNETITLGDTESFVLNALGVGMYNWSIGCFDISENPVFSPLRFFNIILATAYDGRSTDLSQTDVSSISNFTLERTLYGRIEYNQTVNLSGGVDLDTVVTITDEFIEVDSASEPRLNLPATLFMYGLAYDFNPVILQNGSICASSECQILSYGSGNLSFNVSGFSNFSLSENSRLDIWDETDPEEGSQVKYADDDIRFFANYTNLTNGTYINATDICNITFGDGTHYMTFNSTSLLYEYNRSFSIYGTYDWDVYCNGTTLGYEPLTVSDTVNVATLTPSNDPEYGFKVQTGGHEIISTGTHIIPITPVNNISRAFIMPPHYYSTGQENVTPTDGNGAQTDHDWADYTIHLQNTSAINVTRVATDSNILMGWQLIEATNNEFEVYRSQNSVTSTGLSFDLPIGATVNASNSMAWVTGYRTTNTGRDIYDRLLLRAYVLNSTHVRFDRLDGTSSNAYISWVVVEWNMSHIDSFDTGSATVVGTTHTNAAPLQVTLNHTVNVSNSIMFFQMNVDNSGLDQVAVAGYLAGSTTIEFYTGSSGTTGDSNEPRPLRWYVIDFGDDSGHRQRGQIDRSSDTSWFDEDVAISQQINLNSTISFVTNTHDGTGDAQPRPYPFVSWNDNETLNIYRTRYGQESRIEWQILELPYAFNPDFPQFFNPGVNKSYAKLNETVRINLTVNDSSHMVDYVNGLISGTAIDFTNDTNDEWYYDWFCNESMVVNFSWAIARDTGDPVLWNSTNISNTDFICDALNPLISFSPLTQANNTFTRFPHYFVSVNSTEANFANITFEIHNASGLVNRTTYATLVEDINFTGLVTGRYYYNVTMVDLATQSNATETREINVDIDNPLVSYVPKTKPNNSVVSGESVFVNVTVTEDNFANITFTLYDSGLSVQEQDTFTDGTRQINWTLLSEGIYYYDVKVTDVVNRQNTTARRRITIDNSIPSVSFVLPTQNDTANVSVNWTFVNVTVSVSNEANITFRLYNATHGLLNSSVFTDATRIINFTSLVDGDYYYNVTLFDLAARNDSTETRLIRIDTVSPLITYGLGMEPNDSNVSKDWIFVNVTVTDLYPKNFSFDLRNETLDVINQSWVNYSNSSFNYTSLSDGRYYFSVTAYDWSGNTNTTTLYKITLDQTAPNATLISPANNTYTNQTSQNFTVNVTDSIELSNVTLYIYNATGQLINQTTYYISGGVQALIGIVYEFLYDGIFTWFFEVADITGNTVLTDNQTIIIDTIYPQINYTLGTEANYSNFSRDWFFINVTVNDTNFANLTFTIDGPSFSQVVYTDGNRSHNFTSLSDGLYFYNATVFDLANQKNMTETREIGLDTTEPTLVIDQPQSKTYGTNISLPLEHTVSDNFIGLDTCWWNIDDGVNQTITCNQDTTFNTSAGAHTINFYANDTFGHETRKTVSFSVSLTGPAVTLLLPENNSFYSQAAIFNFSFTATDPDGVEQCSLYGSWNGGWHLNQTIDIEQTWYDTSWLYRKNISLNASLVQNNLTDFPVLISITDSDLIGKTLSNGYDILFTRADGTTQLSHEIEFFNASSGQLIAWVKTSVNDTVDTVLYMYYNNSGASDQQDVFGVWDSNYIAVYHLDESAGTASGGHKDSTENTFNGTGEGGSGPSITTGKVGSGQDFDSGERIDLGASTRWDTMGTNDAFTIAVWVNMDDLSADRCLVCQSDSDGYLMWMDAGGAGDGYLSYYYGVGTYVGSADASNAQTGQWQYVVMRHSAASSQLFLDNTTLGNVASVTFAQAARNMAIGAINGDSTTRPMIGQMDEVRISNVSRSDAWINASFANQNNPSGFHSFGSEESVVHNFSVNLDTEGTYIWNVECNDTIPFYSFALNNFTIILDTTTPLIDYTLGTLPNNTNRSVNWTFVNVTVVEANEANITFNLYNATHATVNSSFFNDSTRMINFTNATDGIYYYNVTVIDGSGRVNSTETRRITLDTTPPNGTHESPSNNSYTSNELQNLTVNVTDNIEIENVTLFVYNSTGQLINQTTYYVTGGMQALIGILYEFLYDGVFTWFFMVTDIGGNTFNTDNQTITIDRVNPLIEFTTGTSPNGSNVSRNWIFANVTITDINFANVTFYIIGPTTTNQTYADGNRSHNFTNLLDGVYYYNVTVFDLAGNSNSTETREITLETVAPVITVHSPQEINYSVSTVVFNVSLNEAGSCNFTINGGATNYTMDTLNNLDFNYTNSSMVDGDYTARFYCIDLFANLNDSVTVNFGVDAAAPQISFIAPTEANNTFVNRDWIITNVSVVEQNEENITFVLVGPESSTNTFTNMRRSVNWTLLDEGVYHYNVTVFDDSSNSNSTETRRITLDRTDPIVNYTLGTEGNYSNKSQTFIFINVSVGEAYPANITYSLYNGSGLLNATTFFMLNNLSNTSFTFSGLPDDEYSYGVVVYDHAGASNTENDSLITLDTTLPLVQYTAGTEANLSVVERNWIFVNVTVSELYEKNITFDLYNASGLVSTNSFTSQIRSYNFTNLSSSNVTYYYNVSVYDWSENVNATVTRYIELIDTTDPTLLMYSPEDKTYDRNESLPLTYLAEDLNLDSCWYNIDNGTNISLPGCTSTTFSVSDEANHTLTLYANDTNGNEVSTSATFFVNSSLLIGLRYRPIGEWGHVTDLTEDWQTVNFRFSFNDTPVVVHFTEYDYDYDDNPCATRIRNVGVSSFDIRSETWNSSLTCPNTSVNAYFLAMEKGIHNISSNGTVVREVEVANFTMQASACGDNGDWTQSANHRLFSHSWSNQPIVLASVQSTNDNDRINTYIRGCTNSNGDTWNTTCVEIGMSGMQAGGSYDPCNVHTLDEEGGYIAWEMEADWSGSESRDNTGTTGDGLREYLWEAYWENDNVAGSQNDPFPMSAYSAALSTTFTEGVVLGSNIRIDGGDGVLPVVNFDAGDSTIYFLADEDMNADEEQAHAAEPFQALFFNTTSGNLFSDELLIFNITVNEPSNTYYNGDVPFNITTSLEVISCTYSLDNGITDHSMSSSDNFTFTATNSSLVDGGYTVNFSCSDQYGNEVTNAFTTFTVDKTDPNVVVYEPQEDSNYSTFSLPLNFTATDVNLQSCWYTNDSGTTNYSLPSCLNITYNASQGSTTLIVYANDSAGNEGSASVTFFVDTVFPLIDFAPNAYAHGAIISGSSVFVNVTVTELNEENITFDLYDSVNASERTNTFTDMRRDVTWTLLDEGIYYYNVTIVDRALNTNSTGTRQIILDDTNPVVSFVSPTASHRANRSQDWIFINVTVTETYEANITFVLFNEGGIVNSTTYLAGNRTINFTSLADGTYEYNVTVYDSAGNRGNTTDRQITLDTVNPLINFTIGTAANNTVMNRTWIFVNVTASDTHEKNITFSLHNSLHSLVNGTTLSAGSREFNFTSLADGLYYYNVTILDFSENENSTETRQISLDNTGPTVVITHPQPTAYGFNTSLPLNYSVSDLFSSVDSCWYAVDEGVNVSLTCGVNTTFNVSGDGEHNVTLYANDTFGNVGSDFVSFLVSTTGPVITLHEPLNDTYYSFEPVSVFFNYTPQDPDGVEACSLYGSWNNGWHLNHTNFTIYNVTPNNFTLGLSGEGSYLWNVECNDSLAFYSFAFKNFTVGIDLTNPLLSYQLPTEVNDSNFSRSWVAFSGNVTENNTANITFILTNNSGYYNATTFMMKNQSVNNTLNFTNLVDGRYYYNISVTDKAGRTNVTLTRTIFLDTLDPEGNATAPANNSYQNNATQNFTGNFLDDIELSNVTLYIYNATGQLINQTTVMLNGAVTATIGILYEFLYDGIFTWFFEVTDFVGNTYRTGNNTLTIDTTLPIITYIPATESNGTYFQRDWIFVNVSLNETNFDNITFALYRAGTLLFENDFSDATRSINWTLLTDNYYHYNVTVYDLANNVNYSITRRITLDNVDPIVDFGVGTYADGTYLSSDWVYMNASVTEINPDNSTFSLFNSAHTLASNVTYIMANATSNTTHNFTGYADGLYYYNITVYDRAGGVASSATRNITLDDTNPGILFESATAADDSSFERNWIYANVSITETNFANITFNLYNASGLVNSTNYTTPVYLINWTGLRSSNVTYDYNVTIIDLAGNSNATETRNITLVDTTPPVLNLTRPQNTTYTNNNSIPLDFSVFDSNTESCWYNLDGGANITVSGCANTTFGVLDEQSYTLYFFVNDSVGLEASANVTFTANSSFISLGDYIIQRGSTSVDGSQGAPLSIQVPEYKSFILHTSRSADSGPDSLQVTATLSDSETITLENYASGGGANVDWEVISGPAINTQRNEISFGTGASTIVVNITSVNLSNSFIVVSNRLNDGTGSNNIEGFWSCSFVNATRFSCDRGATGTSGVLSWQVVSWEGVDVQNGTSTISGGSLTTSASITAVNVTTTFALFSSSLSGDTSIQDIFTRGYLSDGTTLNFERTGNGGTVTLDWFVVRAPFFRTDNDTFVHATTSNAQADSMNRNLINLSQSFTVHSHENAGTGTSFANGFVTQRLPNLTTVVIQKGTASNAGTTNWFTVEIVDIESPVVTLTYPDDVANFTTHTIDSFNYTVSDDSDIVSCTLYGNWSGSWAANETNFTVTKGANQYFSPVTVPANGYYLWSVRCNDTYGNVGWASANRTFASYLPPTKPVITNITQTAKNGTGNVTIFWNQSNDTTLYKIYATESLASPFTLYDTTTALNYTDPNASQVVRRFYNITATNPISENSSDTIYTKNTYTLRRLSNVNSRNRISLFMNATYLRDANDTLQELGNISSVAQWNNTMQQRRICTDFSCPNYPLCTATNCNFNIDYGVGYEVYANTSGPTAFNWSVVGRVEDPVNVTLIKNVTSFGKNWASMYANMTMVDAHDLITSIPYADAVTYWNETSQTSMGYIKSPFPWPPQYIGQNFSMAIEYGYEISVNASYNWTQF